jgi:hypothetical protein
MCVQVENEPETFALRIGVWGIGIRYPFTHAEVYEMLDALVEMDRHDEGDDPALRDDDD